MKDGKIIKHIDELGRLGIPKHMRQALGVEDNAPVELTLDGNTLLVKKPVEECVFCEGTTSLILFNGKHICPSCIAKLTVL
jgi:transcriptional pleiotropic regulator of transition state genes